MSKVSQSPSRAAEPEEASWGEVLALKIGLACILVILSAGLFFWLANLLSR